MSEPLEVTEHDIDAISCKVGFHASAWDCADQIELVRAIVSHFRPKASPIGYVRPGILEALSAHDEPHERYPIQKRRGDGFEVPIYAAMPYKPREYSDAEIMAVDRKHVDHIIAVMEPPK